MYCAPITFLHYFKEHKYYFKEHKYYFKEHKYYFKEHKYYFKEHKGGQPRTQGLSLGKSLSQRRKERPWVRG